MAEPRRSRQEALALTIYQDDNKFWVQKLGYNWDMPLTNMNVQDMKAIVAYIRAMPVPPGP